MSRSATIRDREFLASLAQVSWRNEDGTTETVPWIGAGPPPADRLVSAGTAVKPRRTARPTRVEHVPLTYQGETWDTPKIAETLARLHDLQREKSELLDVIAKPTPSEAGLIEDARRAKAESLIFQEELEVTRKSLREALQRNSQQTVTAAQPCVSVDGMRYDAEAIRILRRCEREASTRMHRSEADEALLKKALAGTRERLEAEEAARLRAEQEVTNLRRELEAALAAKPVPEAVTARPDGTVLGWRPRPMTAWRRVG